jgi:hypothetical protein
MRRTGPALPRAVSALALAAGLLAGGVARAQAASSVAETLFTDGRGLYDQRRFVEACPKFRESDRIEPAVGTKLNLALCEEALGHVATAWALFRVVAETLPVGDARLAIAEQHRNHLAPQVPHLTIRLRVSAPRDTRVTLGDVVLSGPTFGIPLAVDPGAHALRIEAPGHLAATATVTATTGREVEVEVAPGPPLVPATVATPRTAPPAVRSSHAEPAPSPLPPLRIAALGLAGAGLAGWVASGVSAAQASHDDDRSLVLGCQDNRCPPAAKQARVDALSSADRATVFAVVGTALFAGGGILWFVGAPDQRLHAGVVATRDRVVGAIAGSLW